MPRQRGGKLNFPEYWPVPIPKWQHGGVHKLSAIHFSLDAQNIDVDTANDILEQAEAAYTAVTNELQDFRQANGRKTIKIFIRDLGPQVFDYPNASLNNCQINIPARFVMGDPSNGGSSHQGSCSGPKALSNRGPTLWHNVVNLLYPPNLTNPSDPVEPRFYCEGLGGYMQDILASKSASKSWPPRYYPTMGLHTDDATVKMMLLCGAPKQNQNWCYGYLDSPNHEHSPWRRFAWLQAASYVKYLLLNDRPAFADWYCGRSATPPTLWNKWRQYIEQYANANFELPPRSSKSLKQAAPKRQPKKAPPQRRK